MNRMDPHALAEILGIDIDHPKPKARTTNKTHTNGQKPDQGEPVFLDWYQGVRKALEHRTDPPDRSADAYRVLCACFDAGLTLAQEWWVLHQRDDLAEWIEENPPGELETTVDKIRALREAEKTTAAPESEDTKPRYFDMAAMLDGTLPEPPKPEVLTRQDGYCFFYKRRVNTLFGDSEVGKTWIALAACAEELQRGGKVAILDFDHNGPEATAAALLALGAPYAALRDPNRFRYIEPEDMANTLKIVLDLKEWKPDVVLVDSITELLVLLGKSSNSGDDYTAANRMVAQPIADAGAAAITIDHPAKNFTSRTMGPTGAVAKRAVIGGISLRVAVCRRFIPGKGGSAFLSINKDRAGGVRAHCPASHGKGEQRAGTFIHGPTRRGRRHELAHHCPTARARRADRAAGAIPASRHRDQPRMVHPQDDHGPSHRERRTQTQREGTSQTSVRSTGCRTATPAGMQPRRQGSGQCDDVSAGRIKSRCP